MRLKTRHLLPAMRRPDSAFEPAAVNVSATIARSMPDKAAPCFGFVMTRIDFHSNVPNKIAYACRLARKARAADSQIVILAQDRRQLGELDELLWTFSEHDFLPHVMLDDAWAAQTPILLTTEGAMESPHHHILINLSDTPPAHFARFERMFEVISSDDADKSAGRERYRYYQQRGYPLTHFIAEHS
jgi:DNA polymerase-3 subunit chi